MASGSECVSISRSKMGIYDILLDYLNKPHKKKVLSIALIAILFICVNISAALFLSIDGPTSADLGDSVTYDYYILNDGLDDLHDINIIDSQFGTIPVGDLGVMADTHKIYTHVINESNMPVLTNNAIAMGVDSNGRDVSSNSASHDIYLGFRGNLDVYKTPSNPPSGYKNGYPIGHTITYAFLVFNNNAFSIHDLVVSDELYHPSAISEYVTLNETTLGPHENASGTITYTVAQEDILGPPDPKIGHGRAVITDIANAIAYPSWESVGGATVSGVVTKTVKIEYTSSNKINKTTTQPIGAPNSQTTFPIRITNTGDTILNRTELSDTLPKGLTYISATPAPSTVSVNPDSTTTLYWINLSQNFGRVLNPGEYFDVVIVAEFDGSKYGTLKNTATATSYDFRGDPKSVSDDESVQAKKQNIEVSKEAVPDNCAPGAFVNFTLTVTNSGNITLTDVAVHDVLPLGLTYSSSSSGGYNIGQDVYWDNIGSLLEGESKALWINVSANGPVSGIITLTNNAYVEGKPEYGNNVTNSTDKNINVAEPRISVTKTLATPSDGEASSGAPLTYTIDVENTGFVDLEHVFVWDLFDAGLIPTTSAGWSMNGQYMNQSDIGPLVVGDKKTLTLHGTVTSTTTGTLYNTVTVNARPKNGGNNVTATDDAPVAVKASKISVTKTLTNPASGEASTGAPLVFSIDVENTGDIDLEHVFVWDLFDAGLIPTTSTGWTMNGQYMNQSDIGPLAVGAKKTLNLLNGQVTSTTSGTLYNTVTVDARPKNGGNNVTDTDDAPVEVRAPKISVTKTLTDPASGEAATGALLTFSIDVENTGDIDLEHVFVWDLFDAGLIPRTSAGWSMNGQYMNQSDLGSLAIGAKKTLTLYGAVTSTTSGTLYNTVTVDARPKNGGNNVTATDDAPVAIKAPKISVTKTLTDPASGQAAAGSPLTFSIDVENTGDIDLEHVFVWDLFDSGLIPRTSAGWSMNGQYMNISDIGSLAIGEKKTLTLYGAVTSTTSGTLYNTVTVDAEPASGGNNVTATDDAPVQVRVPKISVVKTLTDPANSEATPGTPLTFSIDVENTGNINLAHVFVWDLFDAGLLPAASAGWRMNGQYMNISDIGPLAIGAKKTLTLYGLDGPTASGTLLNTVTVDACS